jgi:hypothetical protein
LYRLCFAHSITDTFATGIVGLETKLVWRVGNAELFQQSAICRNVPLSLEFTVEW